MKYVCKKCDYRTNSFYNFERHTLRKYPCDRHKNTIDSVNHDINNDAQNVVKDAQNVVKDGSNVVKDVQNVVKDGSNVVKDGSIHTCLKCSKDFKCSRTLKKHFEKCNGVQSNQCPVCMKVFSNRYNKHYHIHHQSCSPPTLTNELICEPTSVSTVNNHSNQSTNECAANYNHSQHCTTNFNKTNQSIHFAVFGKENLDYLLNDANILQRLKDYSKKGVYGLADIVEEVHCNEDQPQNNTIIKPLDYGDGVYIKGDNSKWEYREFADIRSTLIDTITKYVKMYNIVKNDKNIKLSDRRERAFVKKWSYILLSLQGDVPNDLYDELEIDDHSVDDKEQTVRTYHRKFDKASMVKLNEYASKHVKKENGQYMVN